jgi:hypothetical protein
MKVYFRRLTKIASEQPKGDTESLEYPFAAGDDVVVQTATGTVNGVFIRYADHLEGGDWAVVATAEGTRTVKLADIEHDNLSYRLRSLREIIDDPDTDPETRQRAQAEWNKLRQQAPTAAAAAGTPKTAYWWKAPWEFDSIQYGDKRYPVGRQSEEVCDFTTYPTDMHGKVKRYPTDTEFYPKHKSHTSYDHLKRKDPLTGYTRQASRIAMARAINAYNATGDLRAAIQANYKDLSTAEIRRIIAFFRRLGKISSEDAQKLSQWFLQSDAERMVLSRFHKQRVAQEEDEESWSPPDQWLEEREVDEERPPTFPGMGGPEEQSIWPAEFTGDPPFVKKYYQSMLHTGPDVVWSESINGIRLTRSDVSMHGLPSDAAGKYIIFYEGPQGLVGYDILSYEEAVKRLGEPVQAPREEQ